MALKNIFDRVGVIGAGNFGRAVASVLCRNVDVLVYAHGDGDLRSFLDYQGANSDVLPSNVVVTSSIDELVGGCRVLIPVVPARSFRGLIRSISGLLCADHVLIHGTKGLDLGFDVDYGGGDLSLCRGDIKTMSEVIVDEGVVGMVGCISGPNLAGEIMAGEPAAAVVASVSDEVIGIGRGIFGSELFKVYGSGDVLGVELCGVLKNIVSIAAGCLAGLGYGDNMRGFLISRGVAEMVGIGRVFGAGVGAFLGVAGVGDLVATCCSSLSRNYRLGYSIGEGNDLGGALGVMGMDTVEGVGTVRIIGSLLGGCDVYAPITRALYDVLFCGVSARVAMGRVMSCSTGVDVDFL